MRSNLLQLNMTKTNVLWCASSCRQHQIPDEPFRVGSDLVVSFSTIDPISAVYKMNMRGLRPIVALHCNWSYNNKETYCY